jgi:hypothetical protein
LITSAPPDLVGRDGVHGHLVVAETAEGDARLRQHGAQAIGLGGAGPHDDAGPARRDLRQRALRLHLAEGDDDRIVDGLGHLGQQV